MEAFVGQPEGQAHRASPPGTHQVCSPSRLHLAHPRLDARVILALPLGMTLLQLSVC